MPLPAAGSVVSPCSCFRALRGAQVRLCACLSGRLNALSGLLFCFRRWLLPPSGLFLRLVGGLMAVSGPVFCLRRRLIALGSFVLRLRCRLLGLFRRLLV